MPSPHKLFKSLALAEAVTWTLLLAGMVGKYVLDLGGLGVRIGGGLHGFVFLSYCLATVLVAVDQRWPLRTLATGLLAAVVPYATVPFERHVEGKGLLSQTWRLREGHAKGAADSIAAGFLRRPVISIIVALVAVSAVFAVLLRLGPPTQWFS